VRALHQDGAPVDDDGKLVFGSAPPVLPVERFDRLDEPRVLLQHLERIDAGIVKDPAAAIGAAKELVESTCKFILNDYGVEYDERAASLTDLYKLVAEELRLTRESVPASARGSRASHRVLQNLTTAVQSLAELRNELGIGHGRTAPSPALARHARLAANSARAVVEFLLETWHDRKSTEAASPSA
jgi:Abortive infection C-terminus